MSLHTHCLIAAIVLAGPAFAQQGGKIEGFLTDPIEVYDQNEEYLDDYAVGGIDPLAVKVLGENGDMIKIDFAGQYKAGWVFKADVKSPPGCRVAAGAKPAEAKNGSTMGLDGDLCK